MKTREEMTNELVDLWADAMDLDSLIMFFKENQEQYLENLTEKEVIEAYKENVLNQDNLENEDETND